MAVQGNLFLVSAPSGAGKSSLLGAMLPTIEGVSLSVSHTTRAMRPGEENGVHYHFINVAEFEGLVAEGAFLEHAKVFDNYYGTSEAAVRNQLAEGSDVILEIDWQGARQIRDVFADAISVFIAPPSIDALQERLGARGQDSDEIIARRMADARSEMSHFGEYDYLVVNDDFDTAVAELRTVFLAERLKQAKQSEKYASALRGMLGD